MNWPQLLALLGSACDEQDEERRVRIVLPDASYHVREVLPEAQGGGDVLGFVVYQDDPDISRRTDETALLFVRPEQVLRVVVTGPDPRSGSALGFAGGAAG